MPVRRVVAYFCMEYGLDESFPIYSGGLGVLAGDFIKSAHDLELPLVAVGLCWEGGYGVQKIGADGSIDVEVPCVNRDAFRSWVLGLTNHAVVVEPADLRAEIIDWLQGVAG